MNLSPPATWRGKSTRPPARPLVSQWNPIPWADGAGGNGSLRLHARVGVGNGGGKPALILVPGLVVSSRNVAPTARLLQDEFSVYALDLPGFGKSEHPPHAAFAVPALAEALVRWMDAAGLPDAHLLGNSFGCQVIVSLAVRHPARVGRLVLTGPALDPTLRGNALRPIARLLLDAPREPALIPAVCFDFFEMGPRRVWDTFRAALADRIEENLAGVAAPTLVVRGARDPIARQPWAEELARRTPGRTRPAVIPGAAHAIVFSAPAAVARLTRTFLSVARPDPAALQAPTGG